MFLIVRPYKLLCENRSFLHIKDFVDSLMSARIISLNILAVFNAYQEEFNDS